jgi:hypothetical protein
MEIAYNLASLGMFIDFICIQRGKENRDRNALMLGRPEAITIENDNRDPDWCVCVIVFILHFVGARP